jgi:hypothetical protein
MIFEFIKGSQFTPAIFVAKKQLSIAKLRFGFGLQA